MLSLVQADLFKTRKGATVWVLLMVLLLQLGVQMLLEALIEPTKVTYGFPDALLVVGSGMSTLGALLLVIYGATLVGGEYGYDTWKNLLTRHSGRVVFILSKWATLLIAFVLGMLVLLLVAQGLGWVLASTLALRGTPVPASAGAVLLLVGAQTLAALVAGGFGIMGAVIGRSSVAGIITGLAWFMADAIGGPYLPGASKLASFSVASSSLQAHLMGAVAPFALFPSLLVVGIYLVVPIAVAACIFRQRDMVGVG